MKILETGLTGSYLAILGLNWAKIGPEMTQKSQKHTIRPTESVTTIFSTPFKKQSIIFHMKVLLLGIEAQIWPISNPKLIQNFSKIGPKWPTN